MTNYVDMYQLSEEMLVNYQNLVSYTIKNESSHINFLMNSGRYKLVLLSLILSEYKGLQLMRLMISEKNHKAHIILGHPLKYPLYL